MGRTERTPLAAWPGTWGTSVTNSPLGAAGASGLECGAHGGWRAPSPPLALPPPGLRVSRRGLLALAGGGLTDTLLSLQTVRTFPQGLRLSSGLCPAAQQHVRTDGTPGPLTRTCRPRPASSLLTPSTELGSGRLQGLNVQAATRSPWRKGLILGPRREEQQGALRVCDRVGGWPGS